MQKPEGKLLEKNASRSSLTLSFPVKFTYGRESPCYSEGRLNRPEHLGNRGCSGYKRRSSPSNCARYVVHQFGQRTRID